MFTSLLLGMGIDRLSMSISRILKVKQFIKNVNYEEVKKFLMKFWMKMIVYALNKFLNRITIRFTV